MPKGDQDYLIQRIEWDSSSNLYATVSSRYSNESVTLFCDLNSNASCQAAARQSVENGWLEKANSHFIPLRTGILLF